MPGVTEDRLARGLALDGQVRVEAIAARGMVEAAQRTHGLSRVATAALGRALMMCAMLGRDLKAEGHRLTAVLKGNGPLGSLVVTADNSGAVKGYVERACAELPLNAKGKLDVGQAVGQEGTLTVTRDMGTGQPYAGTVALVSGEVAEDFARFLAVSDQQPALVYLGVRLQADSARVLAAGGLLLRPLPGCPEVLEELEGCGGHVARLGEYLGQGLPLEDAVVRALGGKAVEWLEQATPAFRCDCSRQRLAGVLIALGREELADMAARDHGACITCQFCNRCYRFDEEELVGLYRAMGGELCTN